MPLHDTPKLCECGCGNPAPIAKDTDKRKGTIKGQPSRFIHNHHMRGSRNNKYRPVMERFWEKVDKRGPNECWLWTGTHHGGGYGLFGINKRMVRTHRFSYELHNGPIPDGLEVLHECDNPPCVNPAHLFLGTHQDNMDDMHSKDRHNAAKGESVGGAKLTEDQVRQIRQRRTNGETGVTLAKEYGVSAAVISKVHLRQTWRHVE